MPRTRRTVLAALLVVGLVGALTVPVGAQETDATNDPASVLALIDAGKGSFNAKTGLLTLRDLGPRAVWFTDRPARRTGTYSVPELLGVFFDGQAPPNAALSFLGQDKNHDVAVVTLSNPKYDSAKKQLTFTTKILHDPATDLRSDTALADFVVLHDGKIAKSFGKTQVFVDSATPDPSFDPQTSPSGTPGPQNDRSEGSVHFEGNLSGDHPIEQLDVDCTQVAGPVDGGHYHYVARDPSYSQTIFDEPRIDANVSSGATWAAVRTASIAWGHVGSRIATAIRVTVQSTNTQFPNASYKFDVWCAFADEDAWIVAG